MSRTNKLARNDHDHLSLRVAHQMQHAVSSAMAQRSRHLHNDTVVIGNAIDHVLKRPIHSVDSSVAFRTGDVGLVRVGFQGRSSEMQWRLT